MKPDELVEVLERIDVDNRPTSVVVSVRLESDLARELGGVARTRGVRLSDVLREAAKTYAARAPWADAVNYEVQGPRLQVTIGAQPWRSSRASVEIKEPAAEPAEQWGTQVVSQ